METAHLNPARESILIYSQATFCDVKQELRAALKQLQIKEGSSCSFHGQRKGCCDSRTRKSIQISLKKKKMKSKTFQFLKETKCLCAHTWTKMHEDVSKFFQPFLHSTF